MAGGLGGTETPMTPALVLHMGAERHHGLTWKVYVPSSVSPHPLIHL